MSYEPVAMTEHTMGSTPTTPGTGLKAGAMGIVTPSKPPSSYRLLYRGALSLPDSHLLLDGLTFSACLESPSKHTKSYSLLENPLALALESMRGRPSLRFLGVVKLSDDSWTKLAIDIHPRAILSRIYFENTFCLRPFASSGSPERYPIEVRDGSSNEDGPDTTNIIIYAQLKTAPPFPSGNEAPRTIRLSVARITLRPPTQQRLPRPDDPIPRKPPILFCSASLANVNGASKRAKLAQGGSEMNDVFKVPEVPIRQSKGKEKDVFGILRSYQLERQTEDELPLDGAAIEKANKSDIKKITIDHLAQTKDPTQKGVFIDKKHPEWKDLWGYVYRGRHRMKIGRVLDVALVDRLVRCTSKLYLTGTGPVDSLSKLTSQSR
ncbi:hypothetical protein BKA70DRAFT_1272802 [Coprinopsis sp. MPI-PUGE-AT-0042]|nr:hypothetical protein BKA70DRAFT_1272802 [Coprinopsis sp. MPI-PUGE-AT-0042]